MDIDKQNHPASFSPLQENILIMIFSRLCWYFNSIQIIKCFPIDKTAPMHHLQLHMFLSDKRFLKI